MARSSIYFFSPESAAVHDRLFEPGFLEGQVNGLGAWIHQTYCYLKENGVNINLTDKIPSEGVVVFHKGHFPRDARPNPKQYFLCIQADHGRHPFAQGHIVQNPYQLTTRRASRKALPDKCFPFTMNRFLTFWPQPGLVLRDPARNKQISNAAYFGIMENFSAYEQIERILNKQGIAFKSAYLPHEWRDYTGVDLVFAIRDLAGIKHWHKPFSKLLNAVKAGSLVIAGAESSADHFKQKFYPELPVVRNVNELEKAVDKICSDPDHAFEALYRCRERLEEVNHGAISRDWARVLDEAVLNLNKWEKAGSWARTAFLNYRNL